MAIIRLTPELFRKLDVLVRIRAGCLLSVFDWTEDRGCFAYFSFWVEGVYLNSEITEGPGCCCEKKFIKVSNQIDTDRFAQESRPEMDFGAIPRDDIYKFLTLHEIGHCLFDLSLLTLSINLYESVKVNLFLESNELRADRYAWENLFPGRLFPRRSDRAKFPEEIIEFMGLHKEWFPSKPRKVDPISTNPNKMVPVSHVKKGIPWALS